MKEPCIDCPDKNIDTWGFLCSIHCGKRSAWINHQEGIREVVDWIKSHSLISPDDNSLTRFEPFYQIEEKELEKWR